ncbi:MAG: phosphopantothenoylcysteine decarboxylase [Kiritimatiellia bacterium]
METTPSKLVRQRLPHLNFLVTAGPTREPVDPVRYLSNRSSGRMGYAVARAAARRGHDVMLISGPVALTPPPGVYLVKVNTALEMLGAVRQHVAWCDVLVMAAAVADWRPAHPARRKIKKHTGDLTLVLRPTPDILLRVRRYKGDRLFVGFAAETENLSAGACDKLRRKGLDLILANDVSRSDIGFDVPDNQVTLFTADGRREDWPRMRKTALALRLVRLLEGAVAVNKINSA